MGSVRGILTGRQSRRTCLRFGQTASDESGRTVAVDDAYAQTQYVLRKIDMALREVGATMSDVVRTRMFVTDISRWEEIGKAHGEVFGDIRPAATMVEVRRAVSHG